MRVLLVTTYELGHQPLLIAAPAARLRDRGHDVRCLDLSIQPWDPELVDWAERIAFSVPMHTAMRIARQAITLVRKLRPALPVACFGLYGPFMDDVADHVLGGETDAALVDWVDGRHDPASGTRVVVHLGREAAQAGAPVPARDLLPSLDQYAHLAIAGEERVVGYVEASHGCAHRCRHCPVPVIYDGRLRIVELDAVLADAAQQIAAGAQHITFGDPDFLNGAQHSLRIVRALHERHPDVTFDCTVKVEHVLRHESIWAEMADARCLFVVSAFESVDNATLDRLDKGHTAADAARAVALLRERRIEIRPSWMPFTPWTTLRQVQDLLEFVAEYDLVGNVDPVQYSIRLLLPEGSLLLDHPDLASHLGPYDPERSSYTWTSGDPAMDVLQLELAAIVEQRQTAGDDIPTIYQALRAACDLPEIAVNADTGRPRLTEPWFCCAEPNAEQLGGIAER
ncbi:MAG: radical SAM protein [Acidimicrobiia bacterium]|nr:radical SAM protein [Acidimicrobiia bacterium]